MVAAVVAVRTAAIISSIALRTACDAHLPSAIFSARALSSRLDRPCCPGRRSCPRTRARAAGRSARRSGCPAPPGAPAPGSPAGAPPPRGWHLELATGGPDDTQDPARLGANPPAVGQPLVQHLPQVLAQRPEHRRWPLALVGEDDLQHRVQDRITGRGRVTDDEAPRAC